MGMDVRLWARHLILSFQTILLAFGKLSMPRRATRLILVALTVWPLAAQGQTADANDDIVIVGTGLSLPPGTPAYGST